jgi:hypothetical protein
VVFSELGGTKLIKSSQELQFNPAMEQVIKVYPMVYAVLKELGFNIKKTKKKFPTYARELYGADDSDVPISNCILDFSFKLVKRRLFAHVELMHGILCDLVDSVGRDVMDRGDMFVRSIEIEEGVEGSAHVSKCRHDTILYGKESHLQIDRIDETRKRRKPDEESNGESAKRPPGNNSAIDNMSSGLCCSHCSRKFSLHRSLLSMTQKNLEELKL